MSIIKKKIRFPFMYERMQVNLDDELSNTYAQTYFEAVDDMVIY